MQTYYISKNVSYCVLMFVLSLLYFRRHLIHLIPSGEYLVAYLSFLLFSLNMNVLLHILKCINLVSHDGSTQPAREWRCEQHNYKMGIVSVASTNLILLGKRLWVVLSFSPSETLCRRCSQKLKRKWSMKRKNN